MFVPLPLKFYPDLILIPNAYFISKTNFFIEILWNMTIFWGCCCLCSKIVVGERWFYFFPSVCNLLSNVLIQKTEFYRIPPLKQSKICTWSLLIKFLIKEQTINRFQLVQDKLKMITKYVLYEIVGVKNLQEISTFKKLCRFLYTPKDPSSLALVRLLFGFCMFCDISEERGGAILKKRWGDSHLCHFPLISTLQPLPFTYIGIIYGIMWLGNKFDFPLFFFFFHSESSP